MSQASPRNLATVQSQSSSPSSIDFQTLAPLVEGLKSPEGLALVGCAALMLFAGALDKKGGHKGKLAKGRLGNQKEKTAARRIALQQIEANKHNEAALYLGRPSQSSAQVPLFLPDAQRGIAVVGGPGSGKTDSAILPAIYSAVDQDKPCVIWDFKYPTLTKRFVGYAAKRGYDVSIFAPGYRESEVCNPLDFLDPEDPSLMAGQFAVTLNRNFQKAGQQASEDAFFGVAGDQMVQAMLMLAKETQYDDIMMCQAILSLTDLPKRLMANRDSINPWVYSNFGTMLASASSEKTVAGIVATANKLFTTFMKPKLLSAFCGQTTIPLELKGKKILVLGLDREKRDVLAPLVAAVLDLIISRNVVRERTDPLFLFLDEVPTLYLPRLVNWLNECREDGLCTVLGFQNIVQLEEIYGKGWARAILGACATKILFNPQDAESAEFFSKYFDEEEIHFKQRSRSSG
ncbi:MAG: type IV secretory system conjugative DNA transfer family protein, partial [Microcystaceae cyanobacterium]